MSAVQNIERAGGILVSAYATAATATFLLEGGAATVAAIGATVTSVGSTIGAFAASAAFPPALIAAIIAGSVAGVLRVKSAEKALKKCINAATNSAVVYALERNPMGLLSPLNKIPTASWPSCWHDGLKTKGRKNGRASTKTGGGIERFDILPSATDACQELFLGQVVAGDKSPGRGLVVCPWLGPYAVQLSTHIAKGFGLSAPAAELQCDAIAKALLDKRPPALKKAAAQLYSRLIKAPVTGDVEGLRTLLRGYLS